MNLIDAMMLPQIGRNGEACALFEYNVRALCDLIPEISRYSHPDIKLKEVIWQILRYFRSTLSPHQIYILNIALFCRNKSLTL